MNEGEQLWGGRFSEGPAPEMLRLSASIDVDIALLPHDLAATKAHARSLEKAGLLDADAVFAIADACDAILTAVQAGDLAPNHDEEDVHSFVERELTERIGDIGRRIHAGRSRNDLVVTGLRLWCRAAATELSGGLAGLIDVIADLVDRHAAVVMPGYTHLQRAQPVSLGFHLAAHGFALLRDGTRIEAARAAADVSVLGAGALAGTTLPIDPSVASTEMGFAGTFENAMDAVSDRDFALDLAYAAALCCVHLSRLGEEIVLWTTSEFSFAHLDDRWSTGSSMMPQKRNPDIAELIRGRAAPAIGELTSLLALLKGLPLAYDRDLQEDKDLVFRIVARTAGCLEAMGHLLTSLSFDEARLATAARGGAAWATDLAEVLVSRGVPFRVAHAKVGELVAALEAEGRSLEEMSGTELVAIDAAFQLADIAVADPERSIAARSNPGGTAPDRVREQAASLRARAALLRTSR